MADKNVRLQAVRVLSSLVRDGKSFSDLLPVAQQDLEARDAALLQELTFGVCRNYGKLDGIVSQLLKKPLRNKDTDVRMLIWLALYEMEFMRTPDYAVTSSYVDLTKKIKKPWARALVNASLRQFVRDKPKLMEQVADLHSLPVWMERSIAKDWPEQAADIFAALNERAPLTLRVNQLQVDRDTYRSTLQEAGLTTETCEQVKSGLRVLESPPVMSLPGFDAGQFSVQDQSAQLAAELLDPKPQERILDACAAPGGKSCHLLELQPTLDLVCLDESEQRLQRVRQNLQRLKLNAGVLAGDAAAPDDWWDQQLFDAILLDAPCSALGAMRRHPDIRLLRRGTDIKALTELQLDLLWALWPLLKRGGRLLYATCSVLKQENEQRVAKFLAETDNATEVPINADWGVATSCGRQILPGQHQADGFYYALLRKS